MVIVLTYHRLENIVVVFKKTNAFLYPSSARRFINSAAMGRLLLQNANNKKAQPAELQKNQKSYLLKRSKTKSQNHLHSIQKNECKTQLEAIYEFCLPSA